MSASSLPHSAARWLIKGVTDDCTTCDCCGRSNLKRTVALMPLDADGNEDGDPVYYGTACAAAALRCKVTHVANTASAARNASSSRDDWAREVISVYGPVEYGTAREQADVWWTRNPTQRTHAPSEYIAELLANARTQLKDTTLGPARPHDVADFRPYLLVAESQMERIYYAQEVPREGAREFHRAVVRDARWSGRRGAVVFMTVYALSAEGAKQAAYTRHALDQGGAARSLS